MIAIELDKVSLLRRTQEEFSYDLKKTVLSVFEGKYRKPSKRKVIDEISLRIEKGSKIGIIGANGAGKSTLLKLICGILQPTTGLVTVKGAIAPLIELGAGFDAEISVSDNIILYGVLLGFSRKQMKDRTAGILDFAGLTEYKHAPVKSLSSGMSARLGFAIATDVQPDILILDEVLSVGDERFRQKCQSRMDNFWKDHATVIVVSHDLSFIEQSCTECIWLHQGQVQDIGLPAEIVDSYLSFPPKES
jgi:ABC-type polysaccharide/polyol phosphate transport system ATPase subunit